MKLEETSRIFTPTGEGDVQEEEKEGLVAEEERNACPLRPVGNVFAAIARGVVGFVTGVCSVALSFLTRIVRMATDFLHSRGAQGEGRGE